MEPYVTMTGNLVSDPSRRVTANGAAITRIRVASNHRRYDGQRGEWVSADPVYLDVNCWRQLGDNVAATLKKGDTVVVWGRLTMREYEDVHGGPRRQAYSVDAVTVSPDLCRYVTMLARPTRHPPVAAASADAPAAAAASAAEPASAPDVREVPAA